jgi:hypothetical protein
MAPLGAGAPLGSASPSPLLKGGLSSLSLTHLSPLPSPYLVATPWPLLKRSATKIISHNTWRSEGGGGVPADPYFLFPAGPRTWRTSTSRTCDQVWRCCRFWRIGFTMLRSSHVQLYLRQQHSCGNVF